MASALPPLTRSYFTRANMPYGSNNTSQLVLDSYSVWILAAALMNHTTTGSTGGTRDPASVWFCRGSSDASTGGAVSAVGVAGTNRWNTSGAFPGAFTRGNNTTNHHWMMLENSGLGLELLLNMSQTSGYMCFSVGKTGTFSGGTVSACPAPSPTTASVQAGQTTYSSNDGGQLLGFFGDTTVTGGTNYAHIVISPTGEFLFLTSRIGAATFRSFCGLWKSVEPSVGDTNNFFVLAENSYSDVRGAPLIHSAASWCASIQPSGAQKALGGVMVPKDGGNTPLIATRGVDSISGQYKTFPCHIIEAAPGYYERGTLPDLLQCGTPLVGGSIPNAAAQERTVAGGLIIPFTTVAPLL